MEQEGAVKFDLQFTKAAPVAMDRVRDLETWRAILRERTLIGQDPARYAGYGYGNISKRIAPFDAPTGRRRFIISGTQTGGLARLDNSHYAIVTACDIARNRVVAEGPIRPSSESLTHGILYDLDDDIRFVFHVHSKDIWETARDRDIPLTSPAVPYGTPAMAHEVARLFIETGLAERRIFAMGGHEDGVVSFGHTAAVAGRILLDALAACRTDRQPRA